MIRSAIITVLLVSTCFQTLVHSFEADDASGFVQPFTDVTRLAATDGSGVLPGGGVEGLVGGIVPDLKEVAGGSLLKRDEQAESGDLNEDGTPKTSDESSGNEDSGPKTSGQGVATYSELENKKAGLTGLTDDLLTGLKKRYADIEEPTQNSHRKVAVALLGGKHDPDTTSVSLVKKRRNMDAVGGPTYREQEKSAGSHPNTHVSLIGGSTEGNSVSLIKKRGNSESDKPEGLGAPLDRRSTSVLSGTERMDRARLGVVADSQADRRAVFYARDNTHPMSHSEQQKATIDTLAKLRRRLVDGVVQSLTEKLALGGSSNQGSGDLVGDVTSTI